jgi:hypothetical protein
LIMANTMKFNVVHSDRQILSYMTSRAVTNSPNWTCLYNTTQKIIQKGKSEKVHEFESTVSPLSLFQKHTSGWYSILLVS